MHLQSTKLVRIGWNVRPRAVSRFIAIVCVVFGFTTSVEAVSPSGAFARSLILPGWGQHALGVDSRATVFAGIEGAAWLGIAGMVRMEAIYTDDYRGYAASVGGANVDGKSRTYFDDLALYETRLLHNQAAVVVEQPDPVLYSVEDDWQWPGVEERQRYRARYNDARHMHRNIDYALLVVTLNHLASAIDAAKLAGRLGTNENPMEASRYHQTSSLGFVPDAAGGIRAIWSLRF